MLNLLLKFPASPSGSGRGRGGGAWRVQVTKSKGIVAVMILQRCTRCVWPQRGISQADKNGLNAQHKSLHQFVEGGWDNHRFRCRKR